MTTARFKDFGSEQIQDTSIYEPVTFRLDGETFLCHSVLPGAAMLEFVSDADSGEGGLVSESILRFFQAAMAEDENTRFRAFIKRPDRITPIDLLAEISTWLVEVYSDRPTLSVGLSPDGTSTTVPGSRLPASSEALIPTG